jgi:hypothetical protein
MPKPKFRFRAFTALIVLWSFVIETVSGIVLYVVPPGRIAYWTNWKLWGMTKDDWAALHTIFGYVFLIFAVVHILYNWKPILSYIKKKVRTGLKARLELTTSLVISLVVTIATLAGLPPFSTVMDIGENLRYSWQESQREPFMAHAELLSFTEFANQIGVSEARAQEILGGRGIVVDDPEDVLKDIAARNDVSPSELYEIVLADLTPEEQEQAEKARPLPSGSTGAGYGWKSLQELSREMQIPMEKIQDYLRSRGIEAKPEDIIRDLAEKHGLKAYQLVNELQELRD